MKLLSTTLLSLFLISCAAMKNLDRPLPATGQEGAFHTTTDGTKIFVYTYQPHPDSSTTLYLLSGITGINHHTEKEVIELLGNGTRRIVVIHPRGTGYSEGKRGDIKKFSKFLDDYIEIINKDTILQRKDHKLVLFGHSMSTAVALNVAEKITKVDGLILVNPPYKLKKSKGMSPGFGEYIKYAFYYVFAPHTPIVNMAGNPALIKNEEERKDAEARINDPLLVKYFSLYYMMKSKNMMDRMVTLAKEADYPLLLIYGLSDSIVDKTGCDEIFSAWKNPRKKYELVENGPHGKLTVFKSAEKIKEWIAEL